MLDLFSQGGPVCMGVLTLILLSLIIVFIRAFTQKGDENQTNQSVQWLKSIGTLGLVVGIFCQLLGLFSAFSVMETVEGVSPSIIAGGLKVSLITTLYGLLIYIIHIVCSLILRR